MKDLNNFIQEKLVINKDSKLAKNHVKEFYIGEFDEYIKKYFIDLKNDEIHKINDVLCTSKTAMEKIRFVLQEKNDDTQHLFDECEEILDKGKKYNNTNRLYEINTIAFGIYTHIEDNKNFYLYLIDKYKHDYLIFKYYLV